MTGAGRAGVDPRARADPAPGRRPGEGQRGGGRREGRTPAGAAARARAAAARSCRRQSPAAQSGDLLGQALDGQRRIKVRGRRGRRGRSRSACSRWPTALRERLGSRRRRPRQRRTTTRSACSPRSPRTSPKQVHAGKLIGSSPRSSAGRAAAGRIWRRRAARTPPKIADALRAARQLVRAGVSQALDTARGAARGAALRRPAGCFHELLGNNDEHLKTIERHLDVRVGDRRARRRHQRRSGRARAGRPRADAALRPARAGLPGLRQRRRLRDPHPQPRPHRAACATSSSTRSTSRRTSA